MVMAEDKIEIKEKTEAKEKKQPAKPSKEAKTEKPKEAKQSASQILAKVDDPFKVIKFVLMTEKAVQVIEKQNKLVFIVDKKADKDGIKASVETAFSVPVAAVQTLIDQDGKKRAFVKFRNAGAAGDIAIKLGII